MAATFTFDGANQLITMDTTEAFTPIELYSAWKEWVQTSDNSKYIFAFTSVGGEPISDTQSIATYIFLNTTDGWILRPAEVDHELRINGNLYSIDADLSLFESTVGNFTVLIIIERSSAAIAVTVGGIDQATVQAALTAQGYTTTRAPNLDYLDADISSLVGQGLTSTEATMLLEMYKLLGLDPTKPLVVSPTRRYVGPSGSPDIDQTIGVAGTTVTATRT